MRKVRCDADRSLDVGDGGDGVEGGGGNASARRDPAVSKGEALLTWKSSDNLKRTRMSMREWW